MKIIVENYVFDASAKTITFPDYPSLVHGNLLLITNVDTNTIIYNFAKPGFGGTVSGDVLTLEFDTTAMSDIDNLQIFYDDGTLQARNQPLLGIETDTDYRYGGGKEAFIDNIVSSGDHDAIVPASGNFIRLFWVSFIPASDNNNANLVQVGFGAQGGAIDRGLYNSYANAHWEVFDGEPDEAVIINTQTNEKVAVTIHYQEITP